MTEWNNRNNQQDGKSGQTESGERYAGQQYANQPGQPSRSAGQYYGNPTGQQIQAAGQHYANPAGQQLQAAGQRYANPAGQQSQTIGQRYANGSVQHGDQRPQAFARPQVQGAPDLVRQQAQRMPDSAVQPGRTPAPGGSPASSRTPAPGGSSASFRTPAPDGTPSPGGMYSSGGTSASGRMPAPGGTSAPGRMPAPARNAAPGGTSAPGRMPAPARTPAAGRTPVPGRPSRADRRKMAPETQAIPDTSASVRRRKSEVIYGDALKEDVPRVPGRPMLFLKGNDGLGRHVQVPFTNDLLSRHLMLLGGIGTGKTNAFFQMIDQLQYSLTQDDIMVIFDTKGDFLQEFFREGDVVISNDKTAAGPDGKRNYWNIFNEINTKYEYESILEISKSLFAEACKNTTQIFFPNAARDLFMACMLHFRRTVPLREQTNKNLVGYINSSTSADLRKMVESYPDMRAMASYISKDDSAQTQGVLSELQQVIRNIFVGNFAKTGNLGLSRLVKAKQGRKIFIEYDLSL